MNKKNVKNTMNVSTNGAQPTANAQPVANKIEGVSSRMNGGKRNRKTRRRQRSCRR
jgi:hypothetical protein